MSLSINQVKEILKSNSKKAQISEAQRNEARLRFHTMQTQNVARLKNTTNYYNWIGWVKTVLPIDKAIRIDQLTTVPLETTTLTADIFSELYKIFDSPNSHFSYEFTTPEIQEDWRRYRLDNLGDETWFKKEIWDAYRYAINSIMIADLPQTQNSTLPFAYLSLLSISDVLDGLPLRGGGFEYLVFEQGDFTFIYDDGSYRVIKDREKFVKDGKFLVDNPHDLGYCPARFLFDDIADGDNLWDHVNPVSKMLGNLDWYLFWDSSVKYNDLSSAFPIITAYEEDCNYTSEEGECEEGYISGDSKKPCPKCSAKKLIGPGSVLEYPAPVDREDSDLGKNPVKRIGVDKGSLDYCETKRNTLSRQIKDMAIGISYNDNMDVAKNPEQINSMYESRANVIMNVKSTFERIHKWGNDTVALLRYGGNFIRSSVNYGSEFYLATVSGLYNRYTEGKEKGLPEAELDAIYSQITDTKFKDNRNKQVRVDMLLNLDPFPHKDFKELMNTKSDSMIPNVESQDFVIKLRFNNFVKRFERENGSIENFGTALPFDERISIIYNKFKDYADEKGKD